MYAVIDVAIAATTVAIATIQLIQLLRSDIALSISYNAAERCALVNGGTMTVIELPILPSNAAIRQCLWPLIKLARHLPTGRIGTIVGRRRTGRHGWDLLIQWGRSGRDWLPSAELRLEFPYDADRTAFTIVEGGRA